jgi:hypothetical protein
MDTIPADRFSVRWDSCLTLDVAQEVAFQLTSDDGSRLFIDGKQTIDNWGSTASRPAAGPSRSSPACTTSASSTTAARASA